MLCPVSPEYQTRLSLSKVFAVFTGFAAVFFTEGFFDPKKLNGKTVKNASSLDAFLVCPACSEGSRGERSEGSKAEESGVEERLPREACRRGTALFGKNPKSGQFFVRPEFAWEPLRRDCSKKVEKGGSLRSQLDPGKILQKKQVWQIAGPSSDLVAILEGVNARKPISFYALCKLSVRPFGSKKDKTVQRNTVSDRL